MYFVKTRNWHCNKKIKFFLDISRLWGVQRGDSYDDGDGKYILRTNNLAIAVLTWSYYMIFYPFSGGWTYVHNGDRYILNSDPE
jgi:hypothetical protein